MEYYYFVIIVIIVLKILFWTFYFYVRAQRVRQTQTVQRFIIVGARPVTRAGSHPYSDRSAIIDHAEPVSATGLPPYAEVVKDGSYPLPPAYDQIMSAPPVGGNMAAGSSAAFPSVASGANTMPAHSCAHVTAPSSMPGITPGYPEAVSQGTNPPTESSRSFGGQVDPSASAFVGQNLSAPHP